MSDPLKHAADAFGMVRAADQAQGITGIDHRLLGNAYIDYDQQRRMMLDQMNQIGMLAKPVAMPPAWADPDYFSKDAILMRLRMQSSEVKARGIEFGTIRKVGDRVDVVVLTSDKTLIMEDDAGLFPSDNFITRLRVLL